MGIENLQNFQTEGVEKEKWHFVYTNNDLEGHPVVFDCLAAEAVEADALFEAKFCKKPALDGHIGRSIINH